MENSPYDNTTTVLNQLLLGYDKRLRPNFGGKFDDGVTLSFSGSFSNSKRVILYLKKGNSLKMTVYAQLKMLY